MTGVTSRVRISTGIDVDAPARAHCHVMPGLPSDIVEDFTSNTVDPLSVAPSYDLTVSSPARKECGVPSPILSTTRDTVTLRAQICGQILFHLSRCHERHRI